MDEQHERVTVRFEVRHTLRRLFQEAQRQGCVEQVRRFPDVFLVFALLDPVIGAAIEREIVTLLDMHLWLDVLIEERGQHGTASV